MPQLILDPGTQLVTVDDPTPTVSVRWDQAVQQAVINTAPGPTIASRAYGILHTAMFNAWASYDPTAIPSQSAVEPLQRPDTENTDENKIAAMSFAAYRVLTELFPGETNIFDTLMVELGLDSTNITEDVTTPAGIGNVVAETLMTFRRSDRSNQLEGFADNTSYEPINLNSNNILDITAWTPEFVPIDSQPGDIDFLRQQQFLTPQWGDVIPFALVDGDQFRPEAPEPFFTEAFTDSVLNVEAATILLPDNSVVPVSQDLIGDVINPGFISQAEEVVAFSTNLTDEEKLIAEFWEDGGGTSFPPGTWMTFGQFVSARDEHTLDDDAILFAALGNAVFDAGIATWEAKEFYDYVRPVRAIRNLGSLGLIGEPGVDALTGESGFVIEATVPEQGVQTILAENFLTFQTPGSDPSPPFAEYTSGHSAFSASAATVLELFTDSEDFGAAVTFQSGESRFEPGLTPQTEVTLGWDTFREASDEAGLSRLFGGIHFEDGDINGRTLGDEVGETVWEQVQFLANGGEVDVPELVVDPVTQLVTVSGNEDPTASVLWDQAVQQAVINTAPGPTVASRAYGILHTAIFDAWAAYDSDAVSTQLGDLLQRPEAENTETNKTEAISFAAYRVLTELFPSEVALFDALMAQLGFDPTDTTTDITTAAGIGNVSAEVLMAFRREDGSNQLGNFADTTGYTPVNPDSSGPVDIAAWTPEFVPIDTQPGDAEFLRQQSFLTPQWGDVTPFALEDGSEFRPSAPEPFFTDAYADSVLNFETGTITLPEGTEIAVSTDLIGEVINPGFIEQAEDVVAISANLTDEQKLIAEFWEDGGGTSFPPGTWMTFGQFVSARDGHDLDTDIQLFFSLGNAVFDAGVATWEAKVFYDYVRPVRAIRDLGSLGLIGELGTDALTGEEGFVIKATVPGQGVQTILAENFLTFQTPGSDPSPPFAEYTSGHSAFSAAGATVLELFTGSNEFGGSITFEPGESRFEPGVTPVDPVTLYWPTFSFAADEGGESRLFGGIHFDDGDLNGRELGRQVGTTVFEEAQAFITGSDDIPIGGQLGEEVLGTSTADNLSGTTGDDTLAGLGDSDTLNGGEGNDVLRGDFNIRNPQGSIGGDDVIFGGAGDDRIGGKGGNDTLFGDDGNDAIWGDDGDDLLQGGLGNDTLTGDDFSGGQGNDTFVIALGDGIDTITDFEVGVDTLQLVSIGSTTFDNLLVTDGDDGALILIGQQTGAELLGVAAADLSSQDVVFA